MHYYEIYGSPLISSRREISTAEFVPVLHYAFQPLLDCSQRILSRNIWKQYEEIADSTIKAGTCLSLQMNGVTANQSEAYQTVKQVFAGSAKLCKDVASKCQR